MASCCKCTQPLGKPVLPELYSQKALSSLSVSAVCKLDEARSIHCSKSWVAASKEREADCPMLLTMTTWRRYLRLGRIDWMVCQIEAWTSITRARLSLSM